MKYKFRLVFHHLRQGFFRIEKSSEIFDLSSNLHIEVFPRDADLLINASKYHIDSSSFNCEREAKKTGEKLRTHFRMLNCILNLGLSIPINDGTGGSISEEIKQKIKSEGGTLLDTIIGLHVYPDEDHFEHVMSGKMNVFPSEPLYVFDALKETWSSTFVLDEKATEVFDILNISVSETSAKVRFLTTYLAMEQVIEKNMRSNDACKLIDQFISITKKSDISKPEKDSLVGTLGFLKEQSFSSAFSSFSKLITSPKEIYNRPVETFVSECIFIRNKIAHNALIDSSTNLEKYSEHLREMILAILWSKYDFPEISLYRPADTISMEKMEIRMM